MLEELRATLPNDIRMAQDIVQKRSEMIEAGKRESDALRRQAEDAARQMISETEIVTAARRKAKEIIGNAEIQARELRRVANQYCEDTLKRTEESLGMTLEEVKQARARFRSIAKT
jgi:cell division septum initiation protein DivIVA